VSGARKDVKQTEEDGLIVRWWCVFWDVFTGGRPGQVAMTANVYADVSCEHGPSSLRQLMWATAFSSL
jgi:hypothetical protein